MNKNVRLGLVLPLIGAIVAWVALVVAAYLDLGVNYWSGNGKIGNFVEVKASTYVVLAGLALASGLALWGFKVIDALHAKSDDALVRAVYRYGGLMIVIALAFDVVFAFATFIGTFDIGANATSTLGGRFLGVYLPIILDALLVVFVLLQSTMWRKSSVVEASGPDVSATQKALAIGYALPIIGTALAIIIGLVVYDFQKSALQNWTWVVIQLIIGASIVFGTRFAAKARAAKPVAKPARVAGATGAVRLNYVLSLVFAGVVSIMSFIFATTAVSSLANVRCVPEDTCADSVFKILPMDADFWMNKMVPAFLLLILAEVAVYLVITSRNKPGA